jgi:hypothetical protein
MIKHTEEKPKKILPEVMREFGVMFVFDASIAWVRQL